tara:strand:+ start:1322 stop:1501 length:180 start_codon:yes stop_codon:yes gene_type:complete
MLTDKLQGLIKSRRFWVAVAGIAVTFSDTFGLGLEPDTIQHVVLLLGAWIVGDSLRSAE